MANSPLVSPPNLSLPFPGPNSILTSSAVRFLQNMISALNGTSPSASLSQVVLGTGMTISSGVGTPEGVVAGKVGDQYMNLSGGSGTTLYVKESGAGTNTGWVGK